MAITAALSQKEMERVAGLAYENRPIRVSLAYDVGDTLTSESTVAEWDALEISGGGYTTYKDVVEAGSYNISTQRFEMPKVDALYQATGAGYTYNKVYVVLGTFSTATITDTEVTGGVATITTSGAHGFTPGEEVLIQGTTDTDYEGYYSIVGTPTSTSFTYVLAVADKVSAASTGTASTTTEETYIHSVTTETPAVSLVAGQTQTYRILLATDD